MHRSTTAKPAPSEPTSADSKPLELRSMTTGDNFILLCYRLWANELLMQNRKLPDWREGFNTVGIPGVKRCFDTLMSVIFGHCAPRPGIKHFGCPVVNQEELWFLTAVAQAQHFQHSEVNRTLAARLNPDMHHPACNLLLQLSQALLDVGLQVTPRRLPTPYKSTTAPTRTNAGQAGFAQVH